MTIIEVYDARELTQVEGEVNDFFSSFGLDRPVYADQIGEQSLVVRTSGRITAAAHCAIPWDAVNAAREAGMSPGDAYAAVAPLRALTTIAVRYNAQREGLGQLLLESSAQHARDDFGADYLVVRVDRIDQELLGWYGRRGFEF